MLSGLLHHVIGPTRLRLTAAQEMSRAAAIREYTHPMPTIHRLAQTLEYLPVFVDWSAFLGIGPGGACRWVDFDSNKEPGTLDVIDDLIALALLVHRASLVTGLEDLKPARPTGREDCDTCAGTGVFPGGLTTIECTCGGLGWKALSISELGLEELGHAG